VLTGVCLLAAVLLAACSSSSGSGPSSSSPPLAPSGSAVSPGVTPDISGLSPVIVYRDTLAAAIIAQTPDKSRSFKLNLSGLASGETVLDLDCAPDGSRSAYIVVQGQPFTNRVVISVDGQARSVPFSESIRGVSWSPDGRRLAVALSAFGGTNPRIVLVDPATGGTTDLPAGQGRPGIPQWSPDGTRLVFDAPVGKVNQLFTLKIGDPAPVQITHRDQGAFSPDWSPDGQTIVFATTEPDGLAEVYAVSPDGSNERPLTNSGVSKGVPRYSPDGKQLAFVGTVSVPVTSAAPVLMHNLGIFMAAADGSGEQMFTDLAKDAWLLTWCSAGAWLQHDWEQQ